MNSKIIKENEEQNEKMIQALLEYFELDPTHQNGRKLCITALAQGFYRNTLFALSQIIDQGESHD